MDKSINEKLVGWIAEKVKKEYPEDISAVVIYGSYVNGTAHAKSDVDCYFIPKTQRAYQFANDFIICGIGYDIFPISWERAEAIADLKETLLPLIGDGKVIYCHSEEDKCKFLQLKSKLKSNLESEQISGAAALERVNQACGVYESALNSESMTEVRKKAGFIIMTLADAAALYHHTYYHFGLKRQFTDLKKLPNIPRQIYDEYLNVIQAESIESILQHCNQMIYAVCRHMNIPVPEKPREQIKTEEVCSSQADYTALAALYEEICSTFNKIYVCCENGDYVLAYLSAVCLQEELDYAHGQLGAGQYDLLQSFHYNDLERLESNTKVIENDFVQFIVDGGGAIKKYDSFEEFEKMQ